MGLTAAHRLGEEENGGTCRAAGEVAESALDKRLHAGGEIVLLEKLGAFDLVFEKGIEAQYRCATVGFKNGVTGRAEGLERHGLDELCGVFAKAGRKPRKRAEASDEGKGIVRSNANR